MRYAAFKGPGPKCGKAMNDWKLLGSPWGPRSFCSGGTDEYRVCLNQKTAPTEFPCHVWQLPAFGSLRFRDKRLPSQHPNPDAMFFIFFFVLRLVYLLAWRRPWKTFHMFLLFCVKNPKISEVFRLGFGFHWFTTSRQVDGATPVIFPSSLLTSAPWCRCYAMVVDPSGPWGHNQVLGEEILERFAAVVSWPSKKKKQKKITSKIWQGCLYGCFVLSILISWITYVAYAKSLLGLWKYNIMKYICLVILWVHLLAQWNRMCDAFSMPTVQRSSVPKDS